MSPPTWGTVSLFPLETVTTTRISTGELYFASYNGPSSVHFQVFC